MHSRTTTAASIIDVRVLDSKPEIASARRGRHDVGDGVQVDTDGNTKGPARKANDAIFCHPKAIYSFACDALPEIARAHLSPFQRGSWIDRCSQYVRDTLETFTVLYASKPRIEDQYSVLLPEVAPETKNTSLPVDLQTSEVRL